MNEMASNPAAESEIELYLSLIGSFIPEKGIAYVGTPITTGERFINWYTNHGIFLKGSSRYTDDHRAAVIEPNCADASRRITSLRKRLAAPLIDPSAFERPGWSQETYRCFWGAVIKRFVSSVIFLDGWHYSNGCAYEFFVALKASLPIMDEKLMPISQDDGLRLLAQGVDNFRRVHLSVDFIMTIIQALQVDTNAEAERGVAP